MRLSRQREGLMPSCCAETSPLPNGPSARSARLAVARPEAGPRESCMHGWLHAGHWELDGMKALSLSPAEQGVFARAGLELQCEDCAAPIQAVHLLQLRRMEDWAGVLWCIFKRWQENVILSGLPGRRAYSGRKREGSEGAIR